MTSAIAAGAGFDAHKAQQAVKWTVYGLLIVNFGFYIFEDWTRAAHTLHEGSTLLDWTSEFATSLDESAWFLLLFMFELETYVLEDRHWKRWVALSVRGVRLFCYALIAHTVYAYAVTVINLQPSVQVEDAQDLCSLADADVSYVYNLKYTAIDQGSCAGLSDAAEFYWVGQDPVVSDLDGLNLERDLAWADMIEVVAWLVVLLAIEVVVRLQDRGVTGGALVSTANSTKILLYLLLIGIGVYWASLSHWLYLWDELLWIGGFAAIEMNVSEWRKEMLGEQAAGAELAAGRQPA